MFGGFWDFCYFCSNFLKPERMKINHWLRTLLCTIAVVAGLSLLKSPQCKDTVEHCRLQSAMWETFGGNQFHT